MFTSEGYEKEKRFCPGAWFVSPGWAEEGIEGLIKELHLDAVEGYLPEFFLDMLFDSYQRCLFIDSGVEGAGGYRRKSEAVAEGLGLRHDCRGCELDKFRETNTELKRKVSG